jgi:glycosyltransferase involved in cell wall biosynthesis
MPHELVAFFQDAGSVDFIFTGLVVAVWCLLVLYEVLFRIRLAFLKLPPVSNKVVPISVIMVERNEEENLKKNLQGWLSINYPNYELLVVDDFSEDHSLTIIGVLKLQYPRLKLTGLNQETRYSQKLSRNLALKAASFGHVVFVSPSAQMPEPCWLYAIAGAFISGKDVLVGYTGLVPEKGFYHRLYRMESFFQQTESMAFCLNGLPFVVNEENVAFNKQAYFDINGFAGKIREEFLNLELILNDIIKKGKNIVFPSGEMVQRKEIATGKTEFIELLNKSFRLNRTLAFHKKMAIRFSHFLQLIWLPLVISFLILYPVMWMVITAQVLILAILYAIGLKRLLKRLNEPGIFLSSLVYGVISPAMKMVAGWLFSQRRKMK